jgi:hypothetical protein
MHRCVKGRGEGRVWLWSEAAQPFRQDPDVTERLVTIA